MTTMGYRLLGASGLRVSDLFLGAMTFGGRFADADEARRMVDAYADAGGNVVDTAINYRDGESETIVGQVLAGRRDEFVLATKYTVSRDGRDPNAAGNHRKNLRLSLETSLRRLGTDHVDVYWVHIYDRHTPIEETMRALDDAVRAGKVLYVGISDAPAWVVARANTVAEWRGWTPFVGLQVPYSLLDRDVERELLPMARSFGMSVAAWSPLAGGILSGKYSAGSSGQSGSSGPSGQSGSSGATRLDGSSLTDRQHAVARAVADVAGEIGASPAQVAIAWVRQAFPAVHPIVGARRLDQLVDNLGAVDVTLPAEAVSRLESATDFELGFPHDFITSTNPWVYGEAGTRVSPR